MDNESNTSSQDITTKMSDRQIREAQKVGDERLFEEGDSLFKVGDVDFNFYIILEGNLEIVEHSTGKPVQVCVIGPGEFTGDIDVLTGRPSIIETKAVNACKNLYIPASCIWRLRHDIPELSDMLLNTFQARRKVLEESGFLGLQVIGRSNDPNTLEIREFFYKSQVPHTFQDVARETGRSKLENLKASIAETPIIETSIKVLKKPTLAEVAEFVGIKRAVPEKCYDLTIIGAGPAGLGSAIYAGSEGLQTLVIDRMGPGGQAGTSSKIENFAGFPSGISGADLANKSYLQAMKFGAQFIAPVTVEKMILKINEPHELVLSTGEHVRTRAVLIATGADYRELPAEGSEDFKNAGIYYSATSVEANYCRDKPVVVVGGGNSAGQAAMFLAQHCSTLKLLLRGDDLRKSMSDYLARRIEQAQNIEVCFHSQINKVNGQQGVKSVQIGNQEKKATEVFDCSGVFVFIGAESNTNWLPEEIALDSKGFILTGSSAGATEIWPLDTDPCELETSFPRVFAAGDVRSGSSNRVAFAIGDGALAVSCLHLSNGHDGSADVASDS